MRRAAILIFVGFVLGGGFGYFLVSRARSPELAQREPEVAADRALPADSEPSAVEKSVVETSALAEALRALPRAAVEPGAGSIKGHVRFETGEPLAGARVTAYREGGPPADENEKARRGAIDDLDGDVREFVARIRWREAYIREAVTGGDGAYELRDLADGEYRMHGQLEGYAIERTARPGGYRAARPGATVDFRAQVLVEVSVAVLLPDGGVPDAARIEWESGRRGEGTSYREWTPETPWIELSPDAYNLAAALSHEGETRSDRQEVVIAGGEEPPALVFQLRDRPGIEGRVIVPEGEEIESLHVYLKSVPKGTTPLQVKLSGSETILWASSESDFQFRFADLAPGTYAIAAWHGDRPPVVKIVNVADGTVMRDLPLPRLDRNNYLVLWVLDPTGKPVENVSLSTGYRTNGMTISTGEVSMIRRPDGSYWVASFGVNPLGDAETAAESAHVPHYLTVRSKQYGKQEFAYQRGEVRDLTVRFGEPGTLELTLAGYEGSDLEGMIALEVVPSGRDPRIGGLGSLRLEPPDGLSASGTATMGPLDPGSHDIVLHYGEHSLYSHEIHRVAVDIQAGNNSVSIPLPRLYRLKVLIQNPRPKAQVSIMPVQGPRHFGLGSQKPVGKSDSVVFEGLAAGEYRLVLIGDGDPALMKVRIPEAAEVVFQPMTINAFEVAVRDPQGGLGAAGLQSGDLVIAINGTEIEGAAARRFLADSLTAEEVKLTVLRGDRKFEVSLDPNALMRSDDLGGTLEPSSR